MKINGFKDEFRFLSNFYPVSIEYENLIYASVEHAYQAAKTLDFSEREIIRNQPSAAKAKRAGKRVTLRSNWESIKIDVMTELVRNKFQDSRLKEMLLATEDCYIEETNNHYDTFWGVCNGNGKNHLGKILMKIREELK